MRSSGAGQETSAVCLRHPPSAKHAMARDPNQPANMYSSICDDTRSNYFAPLAVGALDGCDHESCRAEEKNSSALFTFARLTLYRGSTWINRFDGNPTNTCHQDECVLLYGTIRQGTPNHTRYEAVGVQQRRPPRISQQLCWQAMAGKT